MEKNLVTKIENRDLKVITYLARQMWENGFSGKEAQTEKILGNEKQMWPIQEDPDGADAKKIHYACAVLLNKGLPLLVVNKIIKDLIDKIAPLKEEINDLITAALK